MQKLAAKLCFLVLVTGTMVGCSPSVRMPRWYNPGTAGYQRYQAEQKYDPYPLPDAGPEIVGARPRGFQTPRTDVERSRQYWNQQHQQQPYVVPTVQPTYSYQ